MSKKILSLALVVVMLMSMFAFSTSAADLTTGQIGVKIVSDAVVGAPAGTVVTVKAYYVVPEGEDVQLTNGNLHLAYDKTAFEIDTSDSINEGNFSWGSSYFDVFKTQASTVNAATTISNNIVKQFSDAEKTNYGWNAGVQIQETFDSNGWSTKTGFTVDPECEIFTIQFTALTEIGKEDVIGISANAYNSSFFKLKGFTESTTAGVVYDAANVVLTENVAVPAAKKVYHVKNQIQWADKENNKVNLGIVCGFDIADIGIQFENGTSTNVSSVGVTAKINGVTDTYTERFVYSAKEGTAYYFRAVIGNVPGDYTGTIEITPFVVVDGTTEYGNAIEITADVLASNVAKLPA